MWCEAIVRNAGDGPGLAGRTVDYVDIQWDQCRSTLKAQSRAGQAVRVLLPRGQTLRHGDVLFEDERHTVVVNVVPCDLMVARSSHRCLLAELALELGNLHWPTQITETELIFPPGDEALAAAGKLGLKIGSERRRFEPLQVLATAVSGKTIRILRRGGSDESQ